LRELQGELEKCTLIVGEFKTLFYQIEKKAEKIIRMFPIDALRKMPF
jgi:hypothetical protein